MLVLPWLVFLLFIVWNVNMNWDSYIPDFTSLSSVFLVKYTSAGIWLLSYKEFKCFNCWRFCESVAIRKFVLSSLFLQVAAILSTGPSFRLWIWRCCLVSLHWFLRLLDIDTYGWFLSWWSWNILVYIILEHSSQTSVRRYIWLYQRSHFGEISPAFGQLWIV